MFVVLNGRSHPLPWPLTLGALLLSLSLPAPFAVALNDEVVLRANFDECNVYPGDRIDIVYPAAGG